MSLLLWQWLQYFPTRHQIYFLLRYVRGHLVGLADNRLVLAEEA